MSMFNLCVWDRRTLSEGDTMQRAEAVDVGAYTVVEVVITVHEAAMGTTPTLTIQHSPRLSAEIWLDFEEPLTVDLSRTGTTWRHVTPLTRFLGWSLSGTLETGAVVSFDIVAKG